MKHEDGIFFGMPEAEYHEDDALGSSTHKDMLINAVQAQWKRLAALREALGMGDADTEESVAQQFGSLVHAVVLEGWDAFEERYVTAPDQPHGLLVNKDDIREALGTRCTLPKSATLYEHEVLAKVHGVGPTMASWKLEKALALEGKTEISKRWHSTMLLVDQMLDMKRESRGGRSIREVVLSGGQPEVSVFWTDETGLRLKARFDYLRIGTTVDLKTFAARSGRELVDAFTLSVDDYAYDMQAAHYQDARRRMLDMVTAGQVHGDNDADWLWRVVRHPAPAWTWLTVQTLGMPEIDTMEFPNELVFAAANTMVLRARETYRTYAEKFGEDQPWVADRPHIVLTDETFNPRITGRGSPRWKL